MKILIVGCNGQLGNELNQILQTKYAEIGAIDKAYFDANIFNVDINELDITNVSAVDSTINSILPDIVINASAYTNVDKAEDNVDIAFAVNAEGCKNLAIACQNVNAKLVSISTDYVFGGQKSTPYVETDATTPTSVYGRSKLQGEQYIQQYCEKYFIVRTSWLYGKVGKNFVYTMLKLGKENGKVTVVNDQIGNPTNANDLAYHILKLALTDRYGIYHCTGNGICSWYDFAKEILSYAKVDCVVTPCSSSQFSSKVMRPKYSALSHYKLDQTIGDQMRDWKDAIHSFLDKNG